MSIQLLHIRRRFTPCFLAVLSLLAVFWAAPSSGRELLFDPAFEVSPPDGTPPDLGSWLINRPVPESGSADAIVIQPAGRSGNGLYVFTDEEGVNWQLQVFQYVRISPGMVFTAGADVRTPPEGTWLPGSEAFVQVEFLDADLAVLASEESALFTVPNTEWTRLELTTAAAPAGTVRIRYSCVLRKPEAGMGQSIVNFDNCSLDGPVPGTLLNAGFEDDPFTFDRPRAWFGAWAGESGSLALIPEDLSENVLWQFTGASSNDFWVGTYQTLPIQAGAAMHGSVAIRTPPGQPWVNGSRAFIAIHFLSATHLVLSSYESLSFTEQNTSWSELALSTPAAPPGAAFARLSCYLYKPNSVEGQSIVNFDNASLVETNPLPGVSVSKRVVGIPATATEGSLILRNHGRASLAWQINETVPWLTVSPMSGEVPALGSQSLLLTVNRAGVAGPDAQQGALTLQTAPSNIAVQVFMDMPSPTPPNQPAEVRLLGRQLKVRDRLQDGSLSDAYHYAIKGVAWSPVSAGSSGTHEARRMEFTNWYVADIQLLRAMGANTVYTFLDFGTDPDGLAVLDNLYKNGLKAIVTVDQDGAANTNEVRRIVTAYRNHPAILAWAVGNEWNINLFKGNATNLSHAAEIGERAIQVVKSIDASHPVCSIFGDIDIPGLNPLYMEDETTNAPVSTERIVNTLVPSADLWGLNIYRGNSFHGLFTQWRSITDKPMFLSEFGTDAFGTVFRDVITGAEDQAAQAGFINSLWAEIEENLSAASLNRVCAGGTVFEWNDEWWKARFEHGASPDTQELLGFGGAHPDGFANEEWFAIMAVDRRARQAYFQLQTAFTSLLLPTDLDSDGLPDSWEYDIVDANPGDAILGIGDVLPTDDFDGDSVNNQNELFADTDPTDPNSSLRFTGIGVSQQNLTVRWIGGTGSTQYLERTSSLVPGGPWTVLLTNPPPTPQTNQFIDTLESSATRVYRLRANPPGP